MFSSRMESVGDNDRSAGNNAGNNFSLISKINLIKVIAFETY